MDLTSLTASDFKNLTSLIQRKNSLLSEIQDINAELSDFGGAPSMPRRTAKASTVRGRGKRGQLKDAIIDLLKSAGKSGITVKEIAAATKRNPANIYTWFFTTGKKIKKIKKLDGAQYAWV